MDTGARTPRQVVELLLQATGEGNHDAVADLFSVDSVIEMPFGPQPGVTVTFEGREDHRARLKQYAPAVRVEKVVPVSVTNTDDPEVVHVEYDYHATAVPTGTAFVNRYVSIVRVRGGEIVHSRDYANPLVSLAAFGRLQATLTQLAQQENA